MNAFLNPRHKLAAGLAVGALAALALAGCAPGAPSSTPSALSQAMTHAVESGIPGVLVRIDNGDEPYTLVDQADWTERLADDTTFRVGSNSKTATAVLILQLVDAGKIGLDDPLSTWFHDLPNAESATVRMLLNHTAGLADYAQQPEILAAVAGLRADLPTDAELIDVGVSASLAGEPLEGYHYSNTGYALLGQIAERVTGKSIDDLFQTEIAEPLGLTATHFAAPGEVVEAHGYEPDARGLAPLLPPGTPEGFGMAGPAAADGWVDVTDIDQSWDKAAGSIVSTASEWATFQRALAAGELISEESLEQMRVTGSEGPNAPANRSYGLGLEKVETSCGAVWGHDGALPGYRTDTYTDEAGDRSVTVFSTTNFGIIAQPDALAAHDELVDAAVCAMFGDE
jgi:D-alanyl-D-alanine carboxypeptidase